MASVEQVKSLYRRTLRETIVIRRYTGTGVNRPFIDVPCRGKAEKYAASELIGTIVQGDQRVLVFYEDVARGGLLTLTTNDKVAVSGRELTIKAIAGERKEGPTLIAYELQVQG